MHFFGLMRVDYSINKRFWARLSALQPLTASFCMVRPRQVSSLSAWCFPLDAVADSGYSLRMSSEFQSDARVALPAVTLLLQRVAQGDRSALDEVYSSLYPDLKRVARAALHRQGRADVL